MFSGHIESSCPNPAEKFSTRGRNLFAQYLKLPQQVYFLHKQKVFRETYGIDTQNAVLYTAPEKFPTDGQKSFAQGPKKTETTEEFPQKNLFAQNI